MKPWFAPACVAGISLALMSCGASPATQTEATAPTAKQTRVASSSQDPDRTATAAMAKAAAGQMKVDGVPVAQISYVDHCHTAFATSAGRIVIDWATVGNFAPREASGVEVTDLPQPSRSHRITMPLGHDSDDVQSTIGLMATDCAR